MKAQLLALATVTLLLITGVVPAHASERHFAYSYESTVLPPGARELEVWTTWRGKRERFYSSFDHRVEFEVGVVGKLQTAFYLNFATSAADDALGVRTTRFDFRGVSSEWKLQLLDPISDVLGFAPYFELNASADSIELEGKLIFDKRIGRALFAANVVAEHEWRFGASETKQETELFATLGGAYFVTPNLGVGAEARGETELGGATWESTVFYLGPTVSYATSWWWAALHASRQIGGLQSGAKRDIFVCENHEQYQVRLLFSFHI